jgi:hypothetical protein
VQPVEQTRRFFGSTRVVPSIRTESNRVVNRGVDLGFIERKSGSRIKRIDVVETSRGTGDRVVRGQNSDRVEVYRPEIGRTRGGENSQPREQPHRDMMKQWKQENRINTPDNSGIRRNQPPTVRQFRESEQRFEIPRNFEAEKNRMKESFERRQNVGGREGRSTPRQEAGPAQRQNQIPRNNQQAAPAPRQQEKSTAPNQHQVPPTRSGRRP